VIESLPNTGEQQMSHTLHSLAHTTPKTRAKFVRYVRAAGVSQRELIETLQRQQSHDHQMAET
jgi:hypothetical protein